MNYGKMQSFEIQIATVLGQTKQEFVNKNYLNVPLCKLRLLQSNDYG